MEQELIQLQSCHMTQHSGDNGKSPWSIEENITNDKLGELPRNLSEKEVFAIIHFARDYELKALNAGIKFQKGKNNEYLKSQIHELKIAVKGLMLENEKLAEALDNNTKG